jgi:hypothetical protein
MHDPGETGLAQVLHRWSGTAWRKCGADRAALCALAPDALRIRAQRTRQRSPSVASQKFIEEQQQILRLTTPKLKNVWGPVRSG